MGVTIRFNGVDLSEYITVNSVGGRGPMPREITSIDVPYRDGGYFRNSRIPIREIPVTFTMVADSAEDIRRKVDELNSVLTTDKPVDIVFSDEYTYTYYGVLGAADDFDEIRNIGQGEITFVCHDPYKYGTELTRVLGDETFITNNGATPVKPIYEITPTEKVTYIDVFNDDAEYMRIGEPVPVDETPIDRRTRLLWDQLGTLSGWTNSASVENGEIAGLLKTNGYQFYTDDFGVGTLWHGPSKKKTLSEPIVDFTLDVQIRNYARTVDEIGRIEVALLDANNVQVGKVMLAKFKQGSPQVQARVQAGDAAEYERFIDSFGGTDSTWRYFDGGMRITRRGNRWEGYVYKEDSNGRHVAREYQVWVDTSETYTLPVTQVRAYIAQFGDKPVTDMELHDIKVYRWNDNLAEQIPYIVGPEDTVTFDFEEEVILINGEPAIDRKDFGATYFPLHPGENTINMYPQSLDGKVRWRERYL